METKVYVDVLLVINYIVNLLLIHGTAKLTGRRPGRRRIVAAALFGSVSALAIFLPFLGFLPSILLKLGLAAAIVRIAFPYTGARVFGRQLFTFFAVSFVFAGAMLAVWMAFAPHGMLYYNGIVYFDISTAALVVASAAAYGLLTLAHRFARDGRVRTAVYTAEIRFRGESVRVRGLVDTGNSLAEPFSGSPVIVCRLEDMEPLLPPGAAEAIRRGEHLTAGLGRYGLPVRLIPYGAVGGGGMLPAFRPDSVNLWGDGVSRQVQDVYIAVTTERIGGGGYSAILNPDCVGVRV